MMRQKYFWKIVLQRGIFVDKMQLMDSCDIFSSQIAISLALLLLRR
jgi:hypothetical protein